MEILTGRITADAKISTLKDDRKVVNFSIAINDSYKPKDGELRKITTFVNCAYWMNEKMAAHLTKGTLVELCGRIGVSVWNNMKGEAKGSLTFHVNHIKLHGKPKAEPSNAVKEESNTAIVSDDLPF